MKKFNTILSNILEAIKPEKTSKEVQTELLKVSNKVAKYERILNVDSLAMAKANVDKMGLKKKLDYEMALANEHDRIYKLLNKKYNLKPLKAEQKKLQDEYGRLKSIEDKSDYYSMSSLHDTYIMGKVGGGMNPSSPVYDRYEKLSKIGKALYDKIVSVDKSGEPFHPYKEDLIKFKVKTAELLEILKLAKDHGYELSVNFYEWLNNLSHKAYVNLSKYEGHQMSHRDYLNDAHPYYTHLYNEYIIKYDGDKNRALKMLELTKTQIQKRIKSKQKHH